MIKNNEIVIGILKELDSLKRLKPVENTVVVYQEDIKKIAKRLGKDKELALQLWATGDSDARHLAIKLVSYKDFDETLLDSWVKDLNGWGICDDFCSRIVCFHGNSRDKVFKWVVSDNLYVRRAGFSTIAYSAYKKCRKEDEFFLQFLPLIKKYAYDDRDHVRKAVNWVFREIGKRSAFLNKEALELRSDILQNGNKNELWVVNHRLKEIATRFEND